MMLNLSESTIYLETYTLLGKRLILGDKSANSYVVIKERDMFYSLLRIFNTGSISNISELPDEYQELAKGLKDRGFLNDGTKTHPSFNEYNSFSNTLYRKKFASENAKERENVVFSVAYFVVFLFMLVWMIWLYSSQPLAFDIHRLKVFEILLSVTVLPLLVLLLHEMGHYIASRISGIDVDEFRIGLYVIYPTIYLTYKGINVSKTHNRLVIISGGIFAHVLGAVTGLLLYANFSNSQLLVIWILANISMLIANILPLGATDGYFFLSTLLGMYNLRLKGYKTLSGWMHFTFHPRGNVGSALLLLLLWTISFRGLWRILHELGKILSIQNNITNWVSLALFAVLVFRFLKKIYTINAKQKKH